ncbi:MAG: 4-alpha-glucanotransferase, partial [Planctomycetota bacterium]
MKYRSSGILLHITSLPSKFGIGDFGPTARKFADFLSSAGQTHWQILPLNPPSIQSPQSPYDCVSAFAGNPLLISPELLCHRGLLTAQEIKASPSGPQSHVNFKKVVPYKTKLLDSAFERFKKKQVDSDFEEFCSDNAHWLDNYTVFIALRKHFRTGNWCDWPKEFRDIHKVKLRSLSPKILNTIEKQKFIQYEFHKQWLLLKTYCSKLGIKIIGDIPIYVSYQSADVWANPQFFKLNRNKRPRVISGFPPDSFSKTGQLWGNPIYDWHMLKKAGFSWWLERIKHNLRLFDVVRLDHFRGFISYWQVPAHLKTAAKGRWVRTPGDDFFNTVFKIFHKDSFIIEDLGHITPAVKQCIRKYHLTGMRILMSGFDGSLTKNVH